MKFYLVILLLNIWVTIEGRVYNISGYLYYPELKEYLGYHAAPATWSDARLICRLEGGILASPIDEQLRALLVKIMNENKNECPIFTGFSSTAAGNYPVSIEGKRLSEIPAQWAPNEPDNFNNTERCLILLSNGTMADEQCSQVFPYVCRVKESAGNALCNTHYSGYVYNEATGHCYKLHKTRKTWDRASMSCVSEGAQLAVINNPEENKFVYNLMKPAKTTVHLGFRSWYEHGTWITVHGDYLKDLGYENWSAGQPDNYLNSQYCGAMFSHNGQWDDFGCEGYAYFVCELEIK